MNTNIYCYIENNEIVEGPTMLPASWNNISNLNTITDNTVLKELGWLPFEVVYVNPNDPIQVSVTRVIENDKVIETIVNRAQTPEEIQASAAAEAEARWRRIRYQRDELLKQTDMWVLVDNWERFTEQHKENIRTYRQALRDIPQTYTNFEDVVWPTEPQE